MQTPPYIPVVYPVDQAPERHEIAHREWQAHVDAGRIAATPLPALEIAAALTMEALFRRAGLCRR